MDIWVLNTGGTLGMQGKPLRPAKSALELLEGIQIPFGVRTTLVDFSLRQDSTNTNHSDRGEMARQIAEVYDDYDAFVLFHGTDSLAETCAFLSMCFKKSLQKPLFVIGAQFTKDEPGSEVRMQIENTFRVAKVFVKQGVVGVYGICIGDVLHGSRIRKRKESDYAAFYTPGRHSVAKAYPHVELNEGVRRRDTERLMEGLRVDADFEKFVAIYDVSADVPPWVLMDMVRSRRLKGAILICKGAGQIPDRVWKDGDHEYSWIDVIQAATDAGIHIGIASPFEDGRVILNRYELGQMAQDAGAIGLESLTLAMACVKFRMAIARYPDDPSMISKFISTDFISEMLPAIEVENDEEAAV